MKKLNETIYNRLLCQAEEAKERGLHKLANGVIQSLGPVPEDEKIQYSYGELEQDIYNGLWKLATNVLKYYDVQSVDAEKLHEILESVAFRFINEMEHTVDVTWESPLEPKVPGETE